MRTLAYFALFIAVVAIFCFALVLISTFWYEIGSMLDQ